MCYWAKYESEELERQQQYSLGESSGAFCRTFDIFREVCIEESKLNDNDAEGHIWWNKFKELLYKYEPSLKCDRINSIPDEMPF